MYTKMRIKVAGTAILTYYVRIGGTNYYGSNFTVETGTFTLRSQAWATNPATGLAWTTTQLNAAEFGTRVSLGVNGTYNSYTYLIVTYNPLTVPAVTSDSTDNITETTATLNGTITDDGNDTIDYYGFVWDTSDKGDPGNADPSGPPGTWSNGWKSAVGDYGETSQEHNITGLTKGTTYYCRFAAHNAQGWTYGEAVSFETLDDPAITTNAATSVQATTARLNSIITDDGNQSCDVRFGYDTVSRSCNFTAYANTTAWVNDTYTTGQTPYVDISSLSTSTQYYFCVQVRNDVSTQTGGELNFTTSSGVNEPTSLKGIPTATTINLSWVKGSGSSNTLVRYKLNTYPGSTTDGTLAYFDDKTSVEVTGLSPGTTYYFKAWGESGSVYSTDNTTVLVTCTAATIEDSDDLPSVATPDSWFQAPDYTTMSNFFMYDWLNWWADSFSVPYGTFWFVLAVLGAVLVGALTYMVSHKLPISVIVVAVALMVGTFADLVSGWVSFPFAITAIAFLVIGENRS